MKDVAWSVYPGTRGSRNSVIGLIGVPRIVLVSSKSPILTLRSDTMK